MNKNNDEFLNSLVNIAMSFYAGEPCRICGEIIAPKDLYELVYAGYSLKNESRSAHGQCWQENKPKSEWAYPNDEKPNE